MAATEKELSILKKYLEPKVIDEEDRECIERMANVGLMSGGKTTSLGISVLDGSMYSIHNFGTYVLSHLF